MMRMVFPSVPSSHISSFLSFSHLKLTSLFSFSFHMPTPSNLGFLQYQSGRGGVPSRYCPLRQWYRTYSPCSKGQSFIDKKMASSTPKPRLENKVAIITGGAQAIGESIVRLFIKHGAKVVIADIKDDLGELVCQDLDTENVSFVHCDVSLESDVENIVNITIAKYGQLDIMVNNAGIVDEPKLNILDNDKADFERVISVNLTGVFLGIKHAARVMIPKCSGSIITTASVCSVLGGASSHAYTSSKHGVLGLTRNVAAELGKHQIRVNCVSPYFVRTPMATQFMNIDETSSVYSNLSGKELGPQDIANATLFLASDESGYISGHNLVVDGGYSVMNPAYGLFTWKG